MTIVAGYPLRIVLLIVLSAGLSGCTSYLSFTQLKPIPEPIIFADEKLSQQFYDQSSSSSQSNSILYVTDRTPSIEGDIESYYRNERNSMLSIGLADVEPAEENEENKSVVTDVSEFGILGDVLPYNFLNSELDPEFENLTKADQKFLETINQKLAESESKDIYIYVHGYKVVFENPLLITHELWRFMDYEGVFMAYAWPSTPKSLAYFKDIETAQLSGQNLRLLLEYLSQNTDAENIHIIGYSAGTRVVITAIQQLALKYSHLNDSERKEALKIGNVILTASDYDLLVFAASLGNGLLDVPEKLTAYISANDDALGISSFVFSQQRLGQFIEDDSDIDPYIKEYFINNKKIDFINATNAENADSGNGHGYFIKSPWVSSDILMLLKKEKDPSKRGLIREENRIQWDFSDDYPTRLLQALQNE